MLRVLAKRTEELVMVEPCDCGGQPECEDCGGTGGFTRAELVDARSNATENPEPAEQVELRTPEPQPELAPAVNEPQLPQLQFDANGMVLDDNGTPLPADAGRDVLLFRAAALPEDQREPWLNYARAYPPTRPA